MKTYFKSVCALALMTFSSITTSAQENHFGCAHDATELKKFLKEQPVENRAFSNNEVATFRIKHWVITDENNAHNAPVSQFGEMVDHLNDAYLDGGIQFINSGTEYYSHQDHSYMEYGSGEDHSLYNLIGDDEVLNVFWVKTNGWSWARFPSSDPNSITNFVVMSVDHDKGTFVHEFGHTMGLLHTFQSGQELVDGSNCTTTGDRVCDTPADPNADVDGNCVYTGNATDANGDVYAPITTNFMSYYGHCRADFTQGQFDRARSFLSYEDRLSLITNISEAINLTAVANVGNGNITLNWENTDVAKGTIEIEKSFEGTTQIITLNDPELTTYVDTDVNTTKWYSYRVRSNVFGKEGTWSNLSQTKYAVSGCTGINAWTNASAYNGGDQVSFNGNVYEAKWWTQSANPELNSTAWAVWKLVSSCPTAPLDPWVEITNLENDEKVFFLTGQQTIEVTTNHDSIGIDSIRYIIVDVMGNYADSRRVSSDAYPFSIDFTPRTEATYTQIYPIAFSNGIASGHKMISVYFETPAEPELTLTSPVDGSDLWVHPQAGLLMNGETNETETVIDRVEYEIAYIYTNSADVVKHSVKDAPYTLSLQAKLCSRIEITAASIDKWGRASAIERRTVYPKNFEHNITITSPNNGDVFQLDPNNPTTVNVTTEVDNEEPVLQVLAHLATYVNGVRTVEQVLVDQEAPYAFDFTLLEADSIDIVVMTASYYGPGQLDTITLYTEQIQEDKLTILTPADSDVLGTQKGYDFTVDYSAIGSQVTSVDWEFIGSNGYNEVRTITANPFSINWGFIDAGTYSAQATAHTVDNKTIASQVIILVVVESVPTATITSPQDADEFTEGNTVTFTVDAQDQDGTIEYVEWYIMPSGGLVPATVIVNQAPFSLDLDEEVGTYHVWALAYDNDGRAGRSQTVQITINEGSTCSIVEWRSVESYNGGKQVSYNGIVYEAKWWTQGENPEENSAQWDVWKNLGSCNSAAVPSLRSSVSGNGIYPNPATDDLNINLGNSSDVKIFNAYGKLVYQNHVEFNTTIDVSSWKAGVYFVQYSTENGVETTSVVKK